MLPPAEWAAVAFAPVALPPFGRIAVECELVGQGQDLLLKSSHRHIAIVTGKVKRSLPRRRGHDALADLGSTQTQGLTWGCFRTLPSCMLSGKSMVSLIFGPGESLHAGVRMSYRDVRKVELHCHQDGIADPKLGRHLAVPPRRRAAAGQRSGRRDHRARPVPYCSRLAAP